MTFKEDAALLGFRSKQRAKGKTFKESTPAIGPNPARGLKAPAGTYVLFVFG